MTDVCGIPLRYGVYVLVSKTVAGVGHMIIAHRDFVGKHDCGDSLGDRRHWCMQAVLVTIDLEEGGGGSLLD
jgi:hypothetical protein